MTNTFTFTFFRDEESESRLHMTFTVLQRDMEQTNISYNRMEINQFSAMMEPIEIHRAAYFPSKMRNPIGQPTFH